MNMKNKAHSKKSEKDLNSRKLASAEKPLKIKGEFEDVVKKIVKNQ